MAILQANVPQAHLATQMGAENRLVVEYSTDLLLPLPGPTVVSTIRRDFAQALGLLNSFMTFVENARALIEAQPAPDLTRVTTKVGPVRRVDARSSSIVPSTGGTLPLRSVQFATTPQADSAEWLLAELAPPNLVLREMLDAGLLRPSGDLFSPALANAKTFDRRCALVLNQLLAVRGHTTVKLKPATIRVVEQARSEAAIKHPGFLRDQFAGISKRTMGLLRQWCVSFHLGKTEDVKGPLAVDLTQQFGFKPQLLAHEWALNRRERLQLALGTPQLRGPVAAEPVPPNGSVRSEHYRASQHELQLVTSESRSEATREALRLDGGSLRRSLDTVYYPGGDSLNNLTGSAANTLLQEERRGAVLDLIRAVSESRERATVDIATEVTSATAVREATGPDPKLAATHHRFKVIVPIKASAELYDVGLTWCPRVFNPFLGLRHAITDTYERAYRDHVRQNYVPEPVRPTLTWEEYTVEKNVSIKRDDEPTVSKPFEIRLEPTDREEKPDLARAAVTWLQEDTFGDDPDHWVASLEALQFRSGTITGKVRLHTWDEGSDFKGHAHVVVPILRYSDATVDAQAAFDAERRDMSHKAQALEAQARQYAAIKQREFIERQASTVTLSKIVFEALVRRVCPASARRHASYYGELISRCIDWGAAKLSFESERIEELPYPDFPADHFVNSPAVRAFLPVIRTAEDNFFDALAACGSFETATAVKAARDRIATQRDALIANPQVLDQFTTEMVIGEHIEAVMSTHDHMS